MRDHGWMPVGFPDTPHALVELQRALAAHRPEPWRPPERPLVAGCFVCFPRGREGAGASGDPAWAGAAGYLGRSCVGRAGLSGSARAPYESGLLALRVGVLLADVIRALPPATEQQRRPDVVLVDGTGTDHPRRAGLACHLGAALDLPTVGVTHRTLLATGDWPADERGATSPLRLDGRIVGYWLRTRAGRRPLAVHAGWRTDPDTAVSVVLPTCRRRTPAPLREARRLARTARAEAERSGPA